MLSRGLTGTFAIGLVLLGHGCTSVVDGSKEEFARSFTCPLDRVESHARSDLHAADFESKSRKTPPKDIAADPERLKIWEADRKRATDFDDSRDQIVEVRGCGHEVLYACHRFKSGNRFICSTKDYPAGVKSNW